MLEVALACSLVANGLLSFLAVRAAQRGVADTADLVTKLAVILKAESLPEAIQAMHYLPKPVAAKAKESQPAAKYGV